MANTFNPRVITNKLNPNANATSVSGLAKSVSPVNCDTILTVTVVMASNGFKSSRAAAPAPKTTIMVSPMAREAANNTAPTIPGNAAGKTTWRIVSDCVAPNLNDPSLGLGHRVDNVIGQG